MSTAGLPSRAQKAAFTLVELMVVVALIGIMTALILPEMRGTYEDALLRSTSRKLMDAFSVAHSRAVTFNQPCRVRIESHDGKLFVEKHVRSRGGEEFVPLKDLPGIDGELDNRIRINFQTPGEPAMNDTISTAPSDSLRGSEPPGAPGAIVFYPDGTADTSDVLLEDRQGFRLLLRINPTTAHVRLIEPARK